MKIGVAQHAVDKAVAAFRVDKRVADDWIRSNFRKARYVADIVSEDGKPTRLFAKGAVTFAVAPNEDFVITIYENVTPDSIIREKVEALLTRELRKIERKEAAEIRRSTLARLELNVERATCILRAEKSRSKSVKLSMQARIAAIDEYYAQIDADIEKIRAEKRRIAKAVAAYTV